MELRQLFNPTSLGNPRPGRVVSAYLLVVRFFFGVVEPILGESAHGKWFSLENVPLEELTTITTYPQLVGTHRHP